MWRDDNDIIFNYKSLKIYTNLKRNGNQTKHNDM